MKLLLKLGGVLLIVFLFSGTFVFLYFKSRPKPVQFETIQPIKTDIILKTVASGSIMPKEEIYIKSKVSGILYSVTVEPGSLVKQNDLIAQVKIIPDMINLNNAESRLRRAMIRYENTKKTYERRLELYKQSIINDADFQQYQLEFNTAQEEMKSAEDNLTLIRDGVSRKSDQTANTMIHSTIDGMILDIPVKVGNSVIESNTFNEGTTIATVANMSEMVFKGKVDESEVGKIKEGMTLIITVGAIDNRTFKAALEYIAPKGVEENGAVQFEIKAQIELEQGIFLRAGYSANADIVLDKRENTMAITESVLQFDNGSPFVEIETAPSVYEKRWVKTGLSDGVHIEILSGVSLNDKIKVWDRGSK